MSSDTAPLVVAKPSPPLNIPSGSTVSVKIIDSTTRITLPLEVIFGPHVPGHDNLYCPAYSFLIEHASGRKLIYDLGTRTDISNCSEAVRKMLEAPGWIFDAEKDVADILTENGVSTESIEGVIWSHWHFDHTGNMKTFPPSVKLMVGTGFKEALVPAYPTNPHSQLTESDWEGRELVELDFSTHVKVGQFKGIDYFRDGSFYLLDAPGHAIGHTSALARVTKGGDGEEDTFIFMAGDLCHHGGIWKPNEYLPLPGNVTVTKPIRGQSICPGSWFQSVHRDDSANSAFYKMAPNFPHNYDEAQDTMHNMQEFDAADNVFVIIAHDSALLKTESGVKFFPNGTLNNWKKENLAEKVRWSFLEDFSVAAEKGLKQDKNLKGGLVMKPH